MTVAEAFERETGCALHERDLFGRTVLVPADDRLGSFAILLGGEPPAWLQTRRYAGGVTLVLLAGAHVAELDRVLRSML